MGTLLHSPLFIVPLILIVHLFSGGSVCSGVAPAVRILPGACGVGITLQSGCTAASSGWTCCSLQTGLELVGQLNATNDSTATVLVPSGEHVIESPVHLGSASVELVGVGSSAGPPVSIQCTYTIDVDQEQIFNLSYVYTDYTLYFNRSKSVSISNINMRGCQFPLRLDTIGRVDISNSSFMIFSEAVLDIFNSGEVVIVGSVFFNNSGTGISRTSFRGNTGAVAIGFNHLDLAPQCGDPRVIVSFCNFTGNSATGRSFVRSTDDVFTSKIFSGRGGGLAIYINDSSYNFTSRVYDSIFVDNYARSYGGGLFMVNFGGDGTTQNTFLVRRCVFRGNQGDVGAGGLLMTFNSMGMDSAPNTVIISDCSFSENSGGSGGGLLTSIASQQANGFVMLDRCNLTGNRGFGLHTDIGSAYTMWLVDSRIAAHLSGASIIKDCVFERNVGDNAIVSLGYAPFAFYGRNLFTDNKGTSSLRLISILLEVFGSLEFLGNEVGDTAALELLSSAQVRLHQGAHMEFRRNKGRFGASVQVTDNVFLRALPTVPFNPLCFMLYENRSVPPFEWSNVSVSFRENVAVVSSAIYASTFQTCSWVSLRHPFFNPRSISDWPLWDLGNDSKNTGYDDIYSPEYQIGTEVASIQVSKSVTAWPGYNFNLQVIGLDEFFKSTATVTRFDFQEKDRIRASILPQVVVIEGRGKNSTLMSEFSLQYSVSENKSVLSNASIGKVIVNAPFAFVDAVTLDNFQVITAFCPGGYSLTNKSRVGFQCQCLEQEVEEIVHCEKDQESVIIQNGYWVSTSPSSKDHAHLMHFYTCPAGYCRCVQNSSVGTESCVYLYVNSDPDAQCSCNRHGILCGACRDQGVSVLQGECISCSYHHILLVPLLVVIQASLFVAIVLMDWKFQAFLYPLSFYIQVFPYTGSYFHESFSAGGKYLLFLSSAMSFYFPYDFCISNHVDPLLSHALRFLPLLVAVVMILLTLVIRRVKWKRKLKHHGVWTIVLLIYTHTVHTCMSVLNCPKITDSNGITLPRWFPDGSVQCFTGKHIPLALLSIFVLLACLLLIGFVAATAAGKFESMRESLSEGFLEYCNWWLAVELGRRFVFVLLIILFPRKQVALLLLVCIMLTFYGFFLPYKDVKVNIIEILVEISATVLILLVSSGILEAQYALPVSSDSASETCMDSRGVAAATWILLPVYYFPLLLLLVFITWMLINSFRKRHKMKKVEMKLKKRKHESATDSSSTAYIALTSSTTPTTNELNISEIEHEEDTWKLINKV